MGYGYGAYYGKRSAEPGYGYGHAVSYTHRSPQGLHGHYGGYGYGGYYGKRSADHGSYGYGINHYGKRAADAGYYGYGYAHGGSSFQHVNRPYSAYGVSVAHPY